jgi:uncharacterized protein
MLAKKDWWKVLRDLKAPLGLLVIALALALCARANAQTPSLTGRVNDPAGLLTSAQKADLGARLKTIEGFKGNPQMAVVYPASLNGQDIDTYSHTVFRAWRLGQAGANNGLLLVIAPKERKMRLEVGYGLEGTIPDLRARMITDKMKPALAKGKEDWARAADIAINEVATLLSGEH